MHSDPPASMASLLGGRLHIEDYDLGDLAEAFGTPVFVLSAARIRENYLRFESAFAERWPEGRVGVLPAFKAAPYLAVRQLLSSLGAGCDTFGESEFEGAVRGKSRASPAISTRCPGPEPCSSMGTKPNGSVDPRASTTSMPGISYPEKPAESPPS